MYPKTLYGWYNRLVRGYPYNEKTAHILDHTFKPNPRLLSTLANRKRWITSSNLKKHKAIRYSIKAMLKTRPFNGQSL